MKLRLSAWVFGFAEGAVLAFFSILLLPILFFFLKLSIHPHAWVRALFSSGEETRRLSLLFGTTLAIAGLAAVLATAIAILLFVPLLNCAVQTRKILTAVAMLPLFVPGHFGALAWIQTVGNAGWLTQALGSVGLDKNILPGLLYSIPGCAIVMVLHAYPIALGLLWVGWRGAGASALEAAALMMTPGIFWRRFIFTWLRPWLAIGWLLIFLICLLDYLIPFLLRRPVFTVEIMSAFSVHFDTERAAALTVPLIVVSLCAAIMLGRMFRRVSWPAFPRVGISLPRLPRGVVFVLGVAGGFVSFVALGAPLVTFIKMAGPVKNYQTVFISVREQIWTSLLWSIVTALIAVLFTAGLVLIAGIGGMAGSSSRRQNILRRTIPAIVLVLFAIPGSVLGMAMISFWNRPSVGNVMGALYDSGLMLPLGFITLLMPVAFSSFYIQMGRMPRASMEMEKLNPHSSGRAPALAILPRLASPATIAALLVFVLAMQEGHASILLVAPGQETLAIRAYTLLHFAPDSLVAGICLVTLVAMAVGSIFLLILVMFLKFTSRKLLPYCAID